MLEHNILFHLKNSSQLDNILKIMHPRLHECSISPYDIQCHKYDYGYTILVYLNDITPNRNKDDNKTK